MSKKITIGICYEIDDGQGRLVEKLSIMVPYENNIHTRIKGLIEAISTEQDNEKGE